MMQVEIQNLTAAVIGLGIAFAIGLTALVRWLPDYIKRRADLNIKKEDAQLANEQAEHKQEREEQATRWRLLESSIQNQSQLTSQIAIMVQQHERELQILSGMKSAFDGASENLAKLDTYTRAQLEPIFALIQAIHKIAETNNTQGKQSLEILQALKINVDNAISQIKKRETDSQPIAPVVTGEIVGVPVDMSKECDAA